MLAPYVIALLALVGTGQPRVLERPKGTLRVVSIGTGGGSVGTMFAARDAKDLSAVLERGIGTKDSPFVAVSTHVLTDEQATLERVATLFDQVVHESQPQDTFVLVFAGNTNSWQPSEREVGFHFLLHGLTPDSPAADIAKSALTPARLAAFARRLPAAHRLLLMDTEFPGPAFLDALMPFDNVRADIASLLQRSTVVLGVENSREDPSHEHGVLTYHILRAFAEPGPSASADGVVSARELLFATTEDLGAAERTRGLGSREVPLVFARGEDFPLAVCARSPDASQDSSARPESDRGVAAAPRRGDTSAAAPVQTPPAKRYALLVATNRYDHWTALANPIPDAAAIGAELSEAYGFDVRTVRDPTMSELVGALRDCAMREYQPADQLIIFIAGHGSYDEIFKEGYVVARDSSKDDPGGLTRLAQSNLRTVIENIPCEHILLVLDVCFGGTFDQRTASSARGEETYSDASRDELLARKSRLRTRLYLTSGGREYVPDGRPGEHSPFCRKFLEALRTHGAADRLLTFAEILQRIDAVRPQPFYGEFGSNEPGSDFVFVVR